MVSLRFAVLAVAVGCAAGAETVLQYLQSVYPLSNFSMLSAADQNAFFNSLTYYYNPRPTTPNFPSRVQSHPFAGTVCDCGHINLTQCVPGGTGGPGERALRGGAAACVLVADRSIVDAHRTVPVLAD